MHAEGTESTAGKRHPWILVLSFVLAVGALYLLVAGEETWSLVALALVALLSSGVVVAADVFDLRSTVVRTAALVGSAALVAGLAVRVGGVA